MKLLQFIDPSEEPEPLGRVGWVEADQLIDLTSCPPHPRSLYEIYYANDGNRVGIENAVQTLVSRSARRLDLAELLENTEDLSRPHLDRPVSPPVDAPHRLRIWLAGVTHSDSAKLREIEAKQATGDPVNVYEQKYRECAEGGIPELFSKNNPDDLVGHGGEIALAPGTIRLVPETELVTVYGLDGDGQVERLGYTGGNDYTDNGIEAQNPLNLPQAKNWSGGCASLGPIFITPSEFDDAEVPMSCEVIRDGRRAAFKEGITGRRSLNMPEGLFHLERALFRRLPLTADTLQLFYWGTPIVFGQEDLPDGLQAGDAVRMEFGGGIGALQNRIVSLPDTQQLRLLAQL